MSHPVNSKIQDQARLVYESMCELRERYSKDRNHEAIDLASKVIRDFKKAFENGNISKLWYLTNKWEV